MATFEVNDGQDKFILADHLLKQERREKRIKDEWLKKNHPDIYAAQQKHLEAANLQYLKNIMARFDEM